MNHIWFQLTRYSFQNILSHSIPEREIKFICLFWDGGNRALYSLYKLCNHNVYIGISIFPHIDNPQSTGYN